MAGPFDDSYTNDNQIKIIFSPARSEKAKKCQEIVDVQFIRMYADGEVIEPGTYYDAYDYRDAYTTEAGWYVDSLKDETTPDYQQGGTNGRVGTVNGATVDAYITDAPQTGGGDKGFQSVSNPEGWETVVYEFCTFCWCMMGDQCDVWYEGFHWRYTKTAADAAAGRKGRAEIVDRLVADFPSGLQAAFDKFNEVKNFTPCS